MCEGTELEHTTTCTVTQHGLGCTMTSLSPTAALVGVGLLVVVVVATDTPVGGFLCCGMGLCTSIASRVIPHELCPQTAHTTTSPGAQLDVQHFNFALRRWPNSRG
jgi:hypothetical protein